MQEIRRLNTLRGLAALVVVISHYSNSTQLFNTLLGRGAGQIGVMVFFMLSGFLMSYLYAHKPYQSKTIKSYLVARAARVLPLFLMLVVASYLLRFFDVKGILYNIPDIQSLLSHLFLLYGRSVLWTIPTEIFFYISFVFLWWFWASNKAFFLLTVISLCVLILWLDVEPHKGRVWGLYFEIHLVKSLPYFLIGVLFGVLKSHQYSGNTQHSLLFSLSLLCIPLLFPQVFNMVFGYKHDLWNSGLVFAVLSVVFFMSVFLIKDGFRPLENNVGDFLGRISYSVYLLHLPVLYHFKSVGKEQPELYLLPFLAVTMVVSYVSFKWLEDPCRKWIKRTFLAPNITCHGQSSSRHRSKQCNEKTP